MEDVLSHFGAQQDALPKLIRELFALQGDTVSRWESTEFVARIQSFPAVRSIVRATCYLTLICLRDHRMLPSAT